MQKNKLKIYLNGKNVYSKKTDIFESVNISMYKGVGKAPVLAIGTDYYSTLFGILLQYKSGKFVQLINADTKLGYPKMTELTITSEKIIVPYLKDRCVGTSTFDYTYTKQHGKWTVSKEGTFRDMGTASSYISVIRKFSAYKTISLKKKSFTVKPGAVVKVKKMQGL